MRSSVDGWVEKSFRMPLSALVLKEGLDVLPWTDHAANSSTAFSFCTIISGTTGRM